MASGTAQPRLRPEPSEQQLRSWSARRGEPDALGALRLEGLARYLDAPWPGRAEHLWRYTEPESLLPPGGLWPGDEAPRAPAARLAPAEGGALVLVRPGQAPIIAVSEGARRAGVSIVPLGAAGAGSGRLGALVGPHHGLFEALNTAAWSEGVAVHIARGALIPAPIRLVLSATAQTSVPRLLVVAEESCQATIVEEHVGGQPERFVVGVSELFVGPAARLRTVLLEGWEPGVSGHWSERARLERDAILLSVVGSFGGSRLKLALGVELDGPGAQAEIVGFALAEGQQHLDHHTEHCHRAPSTWSNIDFRAALSGQARFAYTGLIRIEPQAAKSEAYQEQRTLLLSDGARADAIPELEILTNDVRCTHGATCAPVPAEQLFYLRSRGIPAREAQQMVVRGFFEPALGRLPEPLRAGLAQRIEQRLDRLSAVASRTAVEAGP